MLTIKKVDESFLYDTFDRSYEERPTLAVRNHASGRARSADDSAILLDSCHTDPRLELDIANQPDAADLRNTEVLQAMLNKDGIVENKTEVPQDRQISGFSRTSTNIQVEDQNLTTDEDQSRITRAHSVDK